MRGFSRMRVSDEVRRALMVAGGMLTAKLVALRLASVLSVKLEGVVVLVPLLEEELLLEVVVPGDAWGVIVMDCGRVMPRLRILSRFTWRMATSTTTSGRARSRSFISFCARRSLSGVARRMMALWLGTRVILMLGSSRLRRAVRTSLASCC